MANITWTGAAGDGNFNNPMNWQPQQVPGSGDTVTIAPSAATAISLSNDAVGSLTISNLVTLNLNDNTSFTIGTTAGGATGFANAGTLALNSGGDTTNFIIGAPTVSLTGTGTILLSNNFHNGIVAGTAGNELDNVGNLIEGAGTIGGTSLVFVNGTAGVVNANQSGALVLNTGSSTTLNSGLLEATGAGALFVESVVNDGTAGKISAAGANVYLQGGDIQGGTVTSSGGAALVVTSGGTLDGSTHTVTNSGTVALNDNTTLDLLGTISNTGTIQVNSGGDTTNLVAGLASGASTVTLTGGGQVVLSNHAQNEITGGEAGDTLVNLNNTISGGGQFASSLTLVNDATIDANAANNALVIQTAAAVVNKGVLESTLAGGSGLAINTVINSTSGGTILASAGNVFLENGSLQGGKIVTSGGGEVIETGTGTLDGSAGVITNTGTVFVDDNHILNLLGTIDNTGTIALGSGGDGTFLEATSATVSLTGTGTVSLSNHSQNTIFGSAGTNELDNVTNVIEGAGTIGAVADITLVNGAKGVIDGNLSGGLVLNVGTVAVANSGLIEATSGGALSINSTTVNDSTGGTILAAAANVYLNSGTIEGGVIAASGGGAVVANSGTDLLNGASQAVTISGIVGINDNQGLQLSGTINNEGAIQENSVGDGTALEISSATVTLTGGGTVVMSDRSQNVIYGAVAADVLDNVNNTIEGSGNLGDNQLTLINAEAGTISATGTANSLTIDTGTIAVSNSGLIESTGSAGMSILNTTISNGTLGVISAAGGIVYLSGADIQGGTLSNSGTGSFVDQNGSTLDGSTHTVINNATITINDNEQLDLLGTITNAGTISLASGGDGTDLAIGPSAAAGTVTLTGGGQVVMSARTQNTIYALSNGSTLINLNNTISGAGTIGYNALFVINDKVIDANAAAALVINPSETFTNNDLLEATGAGNLVIAGTTISNGSLGTIAANGGGVTLQNTDIEGGSLTGTTGFFAENSTIFDGSANTISNHSTVTVEDNNNVLVLGTISNAGTIDLASGGNGTGLLIGNGSVGTVTLTGGGQVVMSDHTQNYIYADVSGETLVNVNNTISGAGTIGYNALFVINDSVIDANASVSLTIDPGETFINNHLLESTSTGGLIILNATISNGTLGTLAATTGAISLEGATIEGGSLTGTTGFFASGNTLLDGTANAVINKSTITLDDNNNLFALGTITNDGTIVLASGGDSTGLLLGPGSTTGTVVLTGSGQVELSDSTHNYIYAEAAGDTLINLNNTISGAGTIGYNGLYITNDAVIDANASASLTIDPGEVFTNNGLIESTGSGGLVIASTTISNGVAGTIAASGGNITVAGATLEGGLVTSAGTFAVYMAGGSALGASTGTITNTGSIVLEDNNTGYLYGVIDNNGVITVASGGDTTVLILETATVSLTGSGTLQLSNHSQNYVYGAATADILDNVGNVIEGAGNIGDGQTTLINGGIIDADDSTTLFIDAGGTGSNLSTGQWLGTGSGGLSIENGTYTNAGLIQADDGSSVTFQSNAALTNNGNNGTLTGGSYGAVSAGDGATLSITGSAVSVDAATIILSGAGSTIDFGGTAIDSTLGSIAAGGGLKVLGGRDFTVVANGGTLSDSGTVTLGGGTFTATSLALAAGGEVSGFGTVAAPVTGAGTLAASGGTLLFTGAVSGEGSISAASGAIVDLTTGRALPTSISGAGTLQLDGGAYTTAHVASTIATIEVDATATLSGTGTLAGALVDASVVTANGGTLLVGGKVSGAGSLVAAAGALLDLAGGGTLANSISGAGTVQFGASTTLAAGTTLTAANVIESANLTFAGISHTSVAGDRFTIDASSGTTATLGKSGTSTFTNDGTFVAGGAGTALVSLAFVDNGSATAASGTLRFNDGLTGTGTVSASAGATATVSGGANFAGALTGAGTIDFSTATVTLTAGASLSAANVIVSADLVLNSVAITNSASSGFTVTAGASAVAIDASGTGSEFVNAGKFVANGTGIAEVNLAFTDTGTVSATGGTLQFNSALSGSGALDVGTGAVLAITDGGSFAGAISGAGTLEIGTATETLTTGASLSVGNVVLTGNLALDGVSFSTASGSDFTITAASGNTTGLIDAGTGGTFTNAGSLIANGAGTAYVDVAFVDDGTASATSGTLQINGGLSGTGTVSAGSGATVDLTSAAEFAGALAGAGTIGISAALTLTTGASLSAANVIDTADLVLNSVAISNAAGDNFTVAAASGATLTIDATGTGSSFANAGTFLADGAGIAAINLAFADTGTASVTAGTLEITKALSGNGALVAGAGAVLDVSGGGSFGGAISGAGTVDIASAVATLTAGASLSAGKVVETANLFLNGAAVTNASGDDYTITAAKGGTTGLINAGSGGTFTNAGSLIANGAGTAYVNVAFVDDGTASVTSGTLRINDGLTGTGTVTAASGATVNLSHGADFGGALTGAGTIEISSVTATLTTGASLTATNVVLTTGLNLKSVAITNAGGDTFTLTAGTSAVTIGGSGTGSSFTNAGSLAANGTGTAAINLAFDDTGSASVTSGTLAINGALSGAGALSVGTGAVLVIGGGGGSFGGAISGAGTLDFSSSAATLTTGASLAVSNVVETGNLTLSGAAITNAAGDMFSLTAQSGVTVKLGGTGTLTNAGSFTVSGAGTAQFGANFINSGTTTSTAASLTFLGNITNHGTIDVSSGVTTIDKTVGATGKLEIGATGTLALELGAGSGQAVDFLAGTGLLDLSTPLDFAGTISGFGGSDQIDLLNTAETSFSYANNVLTVKDGTATVASLHFTGSSNSFSLASDGHGGTLITFG